MDNLKIIGVISAFYIVLFLICFTLIYASITLFLHAPILASSICLAIIFTIWASK